MIYHAAVERNFVRKYRQSKNRSRRTIQLHVMLSAEERETIEQAAEEAGLTVSTWLRSKIRSEHARLFLSGSRP